MFGTSFLYDFGVSQDDAQTEVRALDPHPGDHVLCIASAGEVPLAILLNTPSTVTIDAVDISIPQLYLTHLKLVTAIALGNEDAAAFLGFLPSTKSDRKHTYNIIRDLLSDEERNFWESNPKFFRKGPISLGRYETYIARFAPLARRLLGGRHKIMRLFDQLSVEDQEAFFDQELRTDLLKRLFQLMFHPKLYRKRGLSEQGLQHAKGHDLGLQFYQKFKAFCTQTPARSNWMLQFVLCNQILYPEAYPAYLQDGAGTRLSNERDRLQLHHTSITDIIADRESGTFNKFALSNVSDWLTNEEFVELMRLISQRSGPNGRGLIRYIHSPGFTDGQLPETITIDHSYGTELLEKDRFPFYQLLPFTC